jgi:hypothetical protein
VCLYRLLEGSETEEKTGYAFRMADMPREVWQQQKMDVTFLKK